MQANGVINQSRNEGESRIENYKRKANNNLLLIWERERESENALYYKSKKKLK